MAEHSPRGSSEIAELISFFVGIEAEGKSTPCFLATTFFRIALNSVKRENCRGLNEGRLFIPLALWLGIQIEFRPSDSLRSPENHTYMNLEQGQAFASLTRASLSDPMPGKETEGKNPEIPQGFAGP
jgi:hypothetical protein